jgi:hypothetical protein
MVAKINTGSSLFATLMYNHKKVENNVAKIISANRVMMNRDGSYTMYLCTQSFAPYLAANNKTENPILHISLNPHPCDVLTDEQLCGIAEEYMEKMGYGNQPYLVFKHEDLERKHIHIVSVNVDETGKKISDSNNFYRSKEITRELEKKYNLRTAEKKDYTEELPKLKRVDYEAGDVKRQIANTVKALIKTYRLGSVNEYRALLSLYGVTVEEVKGEVREKGYNGLVYSALDKNGEKVGTPIKSSVIGKSVGYNALQKRIGGSSKYMKENPVYDKAKRVVGTAIGNYRNREGFESELAKNGISVVFRENKDGRIYGATFIDHENRTVFNGSKMGKAYSAGVFHELFRNETEENQRQAQGSHNNPVGENDSQSSSHENAGLGLLSGLMEQNGSDYEAESFARQKEIEEKKRKRKQRRL